MSDPSTPVGTNASGSTAGVRKTIATVALNAAKCEIAIHIGIFFDGTGNSLDGNGNTAATWQHEQRRRHSNVARLFRAYPDDPITGYYRMYVPGVGTPFPQIGEREPAALGNAGGQGGDGRINYGILHVFNAVHRAISPSQKVMFAADIVSALCSNGTRGSHHDRAGNVHRSTLNAPGDEAALRRVDMHEKGGLLMSASGNRANATAFYAAQAASLASLISNVADKPKLKEIFIDVFGFSRGAAEARAFCNWIDPIFSGSRLFGVAAHLRFLGLFDTVASVGVAESAGIGADGHMSWGDATYLRVPARVGHCEHYVAMHENRPSFPLEFVEIDGVKPGNCRQFAYPGMHSDVGGGYEPGEQGRWLTPALLDPVAPPSGAPTNSATMPYLGPNEPRPALNDLDSRKVSQVTLNHMFRAARAANVPLDATLAQGLGGTAYDPFAVHPVTQQCFDRFMADATAAKPLRDWLLPYLAWRYQIRNSYGNLVSTVRASSKDRDDMVGANRTLLLDIDAVENAGLWQSFKDGLKGPLGPIFGTRSQRAAQLASEAPAVLARMKASDWVIGAHGAMFAFLVHDSYAGFRPFDQLRVLGFDVLPGSWEAQGYLRYRRRYEGGDRQLTRLEPPASERQSAVV
jgi:hypothetical protein